MTARKHVPGTDPKYSPPSPGWVPCSRRIPVFWDDFAHYTNLLWAHIEAQDKKIKRLEVTMSEQQDAIDALDALLVQEGSDLNTAVSGIQAELVTMQAQIDAGQPVSLTAISEHVASLRTSVDSAAALVPAATPPPAP